MRLYIHPGLTKTGSTAIQKYLHDNAAVMRTIGYYYPQSSEREANPADSFRSSGNGYSLYLALNATSFNKEKQRAVAIDLIGQWSSEAASLGIENIVVSSEVLCLLDHSAIEVIIDIHRELGIDLRFVYFTRNPYQWFFASWLQQIKREGGSKWISDSLCGDIDFSLRPLSFVQKIREVMRPSDYVELRYEDFREDLVGSFLASLGMKESAREKLFKTQSNIVNRSLTRDEFVISFYTNKASGGNQHLSELLSSLITDDESGRTSFFFADRYSIEKVVEWCRSHSPCILDAYERDLDQLAQDSISMSEAEFVSSLSSGEQYAIRSIEIVIRFYGNILGQARKLAYHKCLHYSDSEFVQKVPLEFNVFLYLMLNEDVLFGNIDPYRHFFEYGRKDNRTFKI